ncbi:MAG: hypothetical protein QOD00_654 [Blastocatellia bacterium]|jgi:hypothetical protein|nr:hypothetical protein [Blastocatellia bacterium]
MSHQYRFLPLLGIVMAFAPSTLLDARQPLETEARPLKKGG